MTFRVIPGTDTRRFRLHGELDVAEADVLVESFKAHDIGIGDLTLDLAELTFIDSSGVRALVSIAGRLPDGATLLLTDPMPPVMRVFDLVGIEQAGPSIRVEHAPA